jgi:Tol biopolymer transport system component
MKKILLLSLIILVALAVGCSSESGVTTEDTGPYAGRPIKSITTLIDGLVKTLDWCPANNLIAFGLYGSDNYVDIFIFDPESGQKRSLTDGNTLCPQKHNGNAAWHPSGDYIAFTAEKESNPAALWREAVPGSGYNCDLWIAKADGSAFWPMTDYRLYTRAVIHPHFSHDGNSILWTERLGGDTEGSDWGEWAIKVADFSIDGYIPVISNIRVYQPGQNHYFYEAHCFNNDDTKILYTANPEGQMDGGIDIYELDLATGETINLTDTPTDWDEHAHYSPDGEYIAWMSATGLGISVASTELHTWQEALISELWLMKSDGTDKQRLTYFNGTGYPESFAGKKVIVSDMTWRPDGKAIAVLVAFPQTAESLIYLVELR